MSRELLNTANKELRCWSIFVERHGFQNMTPMANSKWSTKSMIYTTKYTKHSKQHREWTPTIQRRLASLVLSSFTTMLWRGISGYCARITSSGWTYWRTNDGKKDPFYQSLRGIK